MIEKNTKLYKILFIIGCVVLAIAFSFGLKTMIDYKNNEYSEERPYGAISQCSAGSFIAEGGESCETCPKGYYCSGGYGASKYPCPSGQYQDETGQSSCKTCPSGTEPNTYRTECVKVLSSLDITTTTTTIYENDVVKVLTATATYIDGTTSDVTSSSNLVLNGASGSGVSVVNTAPLTFYAENFSDSFTGSEEAVSVNVSYEENGKTVSKSLSITVKKRQIYDDDKEVSSLQLKVNGSATNSKSVSKGTNFSIAVYPVYADETVGTTNVAEGCTWGTSDSGVASISGGVVNANSSGQATLTVSYKGKAATFIVNIFDESSPERISISPEKIYLAKDGDSMDVMVDVYNVNGERITSNISFVITHNESYTEISEPVVSGSSFKINTKSKEIGDVTDKIKVCTKGISIATGEQLCAEYTAKIYCEKWTEITGPKSFTNIYTLDEAHVTDTCYHHDPVSSNCTAIKNEDGTIIKYECAKYHNRCCGSGGTTPSTEDDACYMNNATGIYVWGKYKNDSNYTLIADKTSSDTCKPSTEGGEGGEVYACYKDANNNYKWATTAPEGYTLVESIKDEANCKVVDKAACYIDTNNKYVWGDYSNNASYKLVESIKTAENCVNPPACYKDKDGNFVWGNYAYNSSYSLIANITSQSDCGESVKVPSTAASTATIIYISVIVMLIAGGSVVYYVYNKKKFS